MSRLINVVCLNGASATGAIREKYAGSTWSFKTAQIEEAKQSELPLVIVCHDPLINSPMVVHNVIAGEGKSQPLAKAACNMVQQIGNLKFKSDTRPAWLPTKSSQSTPANIPALEKLYNATCKLSVEVIAFVSATSDCSKFIQALRLMASPELLCPTVMKNGIRKIGHIEPPEHWEKASRQSNSAFHKALMLLIGECFNRKGCITGLFPTGNQEKVRLMRDFLKLTEKSVQPKDVPSGVDAQPRSFEKGRKGSLVRALGVVMFFLGTGATGRPLVFSIESFMDDIDLEIVPDFPVLGDFASVIYIDAAGTQPISLITKGTPFPKAVDELRKLLGTDHTNGEILAAIFPGIDAKDWHKWFFPNKGRFVVILDGCLQNEELTAAREKLTERLQEDATS